MARQIVFTPKAAAPPPAYSQAVKAAGLVFVSGTAPADPATGAIKGTTIQEQTRQCLANIQAILEEAGSSLARKLGIKASSHVLLHGAPDGFAHLLAPLPAGVVFETQAGPRVDIAHIFVTRKEDLIGQLSALRRTLKPEAALWVSWPKKAARVPTTVTEDTLREVALPLGFVDVKVCAVSEVWSGLKLVVRKELR